MDISEDESEGEEGEEVVDSAQASAKQGHNWVASQARSSGRQRRPRKHD